VKVCLISLGCPKNLIDSEVMAGRIDEGGMDIVYDPAEADVAVVNTCGFIRDAVDESVGTVLDLCRLKEAGVLRGIVVAGCLVQRFRDELDRVLPGADAFLMISDYAGLGEAIRRVAEAPAPETAPAPSAPRRRIKAGGRPRTAETDLGRVLLTPSHTAYMRIAEGCNHLCSFCAIPSIRGRLRSRPLDVLVEEARRLARAGVMELNLVAEDTTDYGRDLKKGYGLPELLAALAAVRGIRWIRVLYAFPSRVTDSLIAAIAGNSRVLKYLDVPIQHFNAEILRSMRRGTSPSMIARMVERLRREVPGIVLRTSVIVGYPGETAARFEELFDFVRRARFERLGAFAFSAEPGTAAHALGPRPRRGTVERRIAALMEFQQGVIEERNKSLVGHVADVIVDVASEDSALGRTEADAPDIDCSVEIKGRGVKAGTIIKARFTGYSGYDLIAEPARTRPRATRARRKRQ
jgi:ribosomal protein S12 methylthiotransferase